MFPKALKQTAEQVSLDHVVETKMELQEHEEALKHLRLEALKDKYDTAACIKLSTQTSIKNVTWSLQQNVAAGAGGPVEQPNGQEVTAKDAVLNMTTEPLEDVETEDMEPTPSILGVQQVPPAVERGSKYRLATKAAKLAKQLKDQEKIAADIAAFALAHKKRDRIVNDQPLQDKTQEVSDPSTPVPNPATPVSTSSLQGGSMSRTNFFSDLAAVCWGVRGWVSNTPPSDVTPSLSATDSLSSILLVTNLAVCYVGHLVLNTPNYPLVPHGFLPDNKICNDNQEEDNFFTLSHRYTPGSKGHI
jgi:hypothetical protein